MFSGTWYYARKVVRSGPRAERVEARAHCCLIISLEMTSVALAQLRPT